jgi:hypothetical protein
LAVLSPTESIESELLTDFEEKARALLPWYSGGVVPAQLRLLKNSYDETWELACMHPTESTHDRLATMYVRWTREALMEAGIDAILREACEKLGASLAEAVYGRWDFRRRIEMYQAEHENALERARRLEEEYQAAAQRAQEAAQRAQEHRNNIAQRMLERISAHTV